MAWAIQSVPDSIRSTLVDRDAVRGTQSSPGQNDSNPQSPELEVVIRWYATQRIRNCEAARRTHKTTEELVEVGQSTAHGNRASGHPGVLEQRKAFGIGSVADTNGKKTWVGIDDAATRKAQENKKVKGLIFTSTSVTIVIQIAP